MLAQEQLKKITGPGECSINFWEHIIDIHPECQNESVFLLSPNSCPNDNSYNDNNLVFEDDFNSLNLNPLDWSIQYPWGKSTGFAVAEPDNLKLENGKLIITAKNQIKYDYASCCCDNGSSDIDNCIQNDGIENYRKFLCTTGLIYSKQAFQYGKFEISCKIPIIEGGWPTFWLFEGDPQTITGQEIDIFDGFRNKTFNENANEANKRMQYGWVINSEHCCQSGTYISDTDLSEDFHRYSIIWDEYKIEWYIDDVLIDQSFRYYNYLGQPVNCESIIQGIYTPTHFPTHPLNIIINLQVKNFCPDASTNCPCEDCYRLNTPLNFEIEYVKVWQIDKGCCISHKYYEASDNLPAVTQVDDFIVAGNDVGIENTSGNVTVKSGRNVTFHAGDYIDLLPGFTVEDGADFTVETQDCGLNNPGGGEIVINNFPDEFTDKMLVSVNGATSYIIRVEQTGFPYNTVYYDEKQIYSNPVNVWDGTCNQNCLTYVECDKDRKVTIDFYNCDNSKSQNKIVHVNCSSAKIINDSLADSVSIKLPDETASETYFMLMPNPCSYYASINYSTTQGDDVNITFFDYTGNKVKEYSFPDGVNNKNVDLSDFSDGIYSYQVYFGNNLFKTDKIVIIK